RNLLRRIHRESRGGAARARRLPAVRRRARSDRGPDCEDEEGGLEMMGLLETTVKMSLVLAVGLAAAMLLRQRSAALRHWVIAATIVCAGSIPLFGLVAPAWT